VRFRSTLILIAILALLVGYFVLVEMRQEKPAEETAKPLLSIKADDIERITVRDNKSTLSAEVVHEGGVWRITEPFELEADQARLDSLAASVAELTSHRTIPKEQTDLTAFDLAQPPFTVAIGLKDGKEEILQVGDKNPDGGSYYVQHQGDAAVYLVYTYSIDDLKRLITEPPREPTATPTGTPVPSPTASPTPVVTPSVTPTPAGTLTPTSTPIAIGTLIIRPTPTP
jgi:hypothetical protein